MSVHANLADGLARLSLVVPLEAQQKLMHYVALLQKWNKVYNLTAVRDADKMLTHHLLDSLAVVPHVSKAVKTILDVGSGAGLPGIPLALAMPEVRVTLLDSSHKKAAFLHQAVIELQLPNVEVACARVEDYRPKQYFGVVICRAFTALPEFVLLAGALVAPGGTLLAMKGVHPVVETTQLTGITSGFRLICVTPVTVPGLDAERHLIFMKAA